LALEAPAHRVHHRFIDDPETRSVLGRNASGSGFLFFLFSHIRLDCAITRSGGEILILDNVAANWQSEPRWWIFSASNTIWRSAGCWAYESRVCQYSLGWAIRRHFWPHPSWLAGVLRLVTSATRLTFLPSTSLAHIIGGSSPHITTGGTRQRDNGVVGVLTFARGWVVSLIFTNMFPRTGLRNGAAGNVVLPWPLLCGLANKRGFLFLKWFNISALANGPGAWPRNLGKRVGPLVQDPKRADARTRSSSWAKT